MRELHNRVAECLSCRTYHVWDELIQFSVHFTSLLPSSKLQLCMASDMGPPKSSYGNAESARLKWLTRHVEGMDVVCE